MQQGSKTMKLIEHFTTNTGCGDIFFTENLKVIGTTGFGGHIYWIYVCLNLLYVERIATSTDNKMCVFHAPCMELNTILKLGLSPHGPHCCGQVKKRIYYFAKWVLWSSKEMNWNLYHLSPVLTPEVSELAIDSVENCHQRTTPDVLSTRKPWHFSPWL